MSRIASSLVLGLVLSLVACDEGVSFDQLRHCTTCGPGQATRGAVMLSGNDGVSACVLAGGHLVMTKNADWVELDASFRPRSGRSVGAVASRSAAREDDSVALFLADEGEIRIVSPRGSIERSIDAIGISLSDLFFSADTLVVAGSASAGSIAGTSITDGGFVAMIDSTTGALVELRTDALGAATAARAPGSVPDSILVVLSAAELASLGVATPASSGSAAGVVRHLAAGSDTLVAWVTSTSDVRITEVAAGPDGSVAIAGVSTADAFTIQQIDSGVSTDRPFVAVINESGSLRWAHALGQTDAPVDAMIVSAVDQSVFVTGADGFGDFIARVDTAGVAWRSAIVIAGGVPVRGLLGVTAGGNLLVDVVMHPAGDASAALETTLTIDDVDVITSSGYGVFEIVR